MISIDKYIQIITGNLIRQIDVPTIYCKNSEFIEILKKYNWNMRPAEVEGWTTIIKHTHYNS
jgi:hypothetical protein